MISLTNNIPSVNAVSAEWIKVRCTFECYPDNALFWVQDNEKAFISMTDGNMVIYNNGADLQELKGFVDMINPCCVFSDLKTLNAIERCPTEPSLVMARLADIDDEHLSDTASSRVLYDMLDVEGLSLPQYEYFAVDICRRLNHGLAQYFVKQGVCAAISLHTGDYCIMNGIASHQKGGGTIAMNGILGKNKGRNFVACCRPCVKEFYEKNGFSLQYEAGYWVKNK
ncbi:MAG: hypothetical protein E7562_01305 [Ruminococcaceae bacterium]|nr:hypothetical protein [Oscillospiraceae bacterium]